MAISAPTTNQASALALPESEGSLPLQANSNLMALSATHQRTPQQDELLRVVAERDKYFAELLAAQLANKHLEQEKAKLRSELALLQAQIKTENLR